MIHLFNIKSKNFSLIFLTDKEGIGYVYPVLVVYVNEIQYKYKELERKEKEKWKRK